LCVVSGKKRVENVLVFVHRQDRSICSFCSISLSFEPFVFNRAIFSTVSSRSVPLTSLKMSTNLNRNPENASEKEFPSAIFQKFWTGSRDFALSLASLVTQPHSGHRYLKSSWFRHHRFFFHHMQQRFFSKTFCSKCLQFYFTNPQEASYLRADHVLKNCFGCSWPKSRLPWFEKRPILTDQIFICVSYQAVIVCSAFRVKLYWSSCDCNYWCVLLVASSSVPL
jgi:hypothetical protein